MNSVSVLVFVLGVFQDTVSSGSQNEFKVVYMNKALVCFYRLKIFNSKNISDRDAGFILEEECQKTIVQKCQDCKSNCHI